MWGGGGGAQVEFYFWGVVTGDIPGGGPGNHPRAGPSEKGVDNTFFSELLSIPCFSSSSRTSAAYRRKNELLSPRERRKGVISAPLGELRAAVLLRTNELLWLTRSARHADGDETRSRAKSGEAGDWADRNAAPAAHRTCMPVDPHRNSRFGGGSLGAAEHLHSLDFSSEFPLLGFPYRISDHLIF